MSRQRRVRRWVGAIWVLTLLGVAPAGAGAQESGDTDAPAPVGSFSALRPMEVSAEAVEASLAAEVDSLVRRALVLEEAERRPLALRADSVARVLAALRPASADAAHWRAVTAGVLADVSGAGDQVRLAREAYHHARRAVELDPGHGGAHHVLGRIQARLLRLGRVTRFFAGRMGLGEVLDSASWEGAEHHLTRAVELDPSAVAFHFELALLLRDRDRPDEARARLERLLELPADGPLERQARSHARALLEEVRRESAEVPGETPPTG